MLNEESQINAMQILILGVFLTVEEILMSEFLFKFPEDS